MFVFIKKIFFTGLAFLSSSITTTPLSCISMNNEAKKLLIIQNGNSKTNKY